MTGYVLTLSGAAQQLSSVLPAGQLARPLRKLDLQPRGTNASPVYLHHNNLVSSTVYGVRMEAGTAGVPPAPYVAAEYLNGPIRLSSCWVLGAAGEFLHILATEF